MQLIFYLTSQFQGLCFERFLPSSRNPWSMKNSSHFRCLCSAFTDLCRWAATPAQTEWTPQIKHLGLKAPLADLPQRCYSFIYLSGFPCLLFPFSTVEMFRWTLVFISIRRRWSRFAVFLDPSVCSPTWMQKIQQPRVLLGSIGLKYTVDSQ